jgi:hypothetical protein
MGSPESVALDTLRSMRMRAQCLDVRRPREHLVDVVRTLCGVNAQLPSAMELALHARVQNLTRDELEACRVQERSIVRTWCMRGTMHLLASDDLDVLLSAIPQGTVRDGWRWLEKRAGLAPETATKVLDEAHKVLRRDGPLTRPNLMATLSQKFGPQVIPAAAGVVWLAGMQGRVAFGPDRAAKPTYVALDDWLGRKVTLSTEPDYVTIARRYLGGYCPAGPRDMAAWWGLPLTQANEALTALHGELTELRFGEEQVWYIPHNGRSRPSTEQATPIVRLLPAFDTYLLGYQSRDFAVPREHQKDVFHGGEIAPVITVDGRAEGTWRYERAGKQIRIRVTPFTSFSKLLCELIAAEASDIGRFFGVTTALRFGD